MSAKSDPKLRLILASTSTYRKQLLERLGIPFTVTAPLPPELESVLERLRKSG
jgi:predicted house-cleaning NTP pyrophosphatase (Maf/HAM1 superfamily)